MVERSAKQADARPELMDERGIRSVAGERGVALAKLLRRHAEVAGEHAREALVALEAGVECHVEDRAIARDQRERGALELQPPRELLRALAHRARKRPLERRGRCP